MAEHLIINARSELSWRRRVLSDVATAVLWLVWLYLWLPVFHKLAEAVRQHREFEPVAMQMLDTIAPISLLHAVLALVGTSALLLLWSLLPRKGVTHAHRIESAEDYAHHFHLDVARIAEAQTCRRCVVHHDDEGRIADVTIE